MRLIKGLKRMMDSAFLAAMSRTFGRPLNHEKSVLLVRTDGIGDFVFFVRYLKSISTGFPGHKVTLVCRRETADLARRIQCIDSIVEFRSLAYRWNYLYRLAVLQKIRAHRPVVAVYCSYHRQHIGDEITLLSGALRTFAMSGNDECIDEHVRRRNDSLYSVVIGTDDHASEDVRYRHTLNALGCAYEPSSFQSLWVSQPSEEEAPFRNAYAVIGPGGSAPIRRWGTEGFAGVADWISSTLGIGVVLCGNRDERSLLRSVARAMKRPAVIVDRSPLTDVVAILKHASLFIGNESGLLHLATSLKIPSVGILGGGHFVRYFPYTKNEIVVHHRLDCYECNWRCPFPEPFCITRITHSDVVDGIERCLRTEHND